MSGRIRFSILAWQSGKSCKNPAFSQQGPMLSHNALAKARAKSSTEIEGGSSPPHAPLSAKAALSANPRAAVVRVALFGGEVSVIEALDRWLSSRHSSAQRCPKNA